MFACILGLLPHPSPKDMKRLRGNVQIKVPSPLLANAQWRLAAFLVAAFYRLFSQLSHSTTLMLGEARQAGPGPSVERISGWFLVSTVATP